jgi:hypothetical protein
MSTGYSCSCGVHLGMSIGQRTHGRELCCMNDSPNGHIGPCESHPALILEEEVASDDSD